MAHIGVRNRTKEDQVLTYDGKTTLYKPNEVRLVEGIPLDFIESRQHLSHPTRINPVTGASEQLQTIQGLRLFDVLSIDEALKAGARPDEDPSVVAARREATQKAKDRAQLLSELKASLVEDGWEPPKPALSGDKSRGGK